MNKFIPGWWPAAFLAVASLSSALAAGLENGDFTKGKSKWLGEGQIAYLKPDGTISPTDDTKSNDPFKPATAADPGQKPKSTPIMELKLHSGQFVEVSQRFKTDKDAAVLNVELTYKGSADFKMDDKAAAISKNITWQPGTTWYWSALVFPKADLCVRLDKRDGHSYKLESVKPENDWQVANVRWDNVGGNQDVNLLILAPPGRGSLWLKSVAVSGTPGGKP